VCQLSLVFKLAVRCANPPWESLKNVTTRQRRLSSEHFQATKTRRHVAPTPANDALSTPAAKDLKALASRRSSYLAIRKFFINTLVHHREPPNFSPLSQRSHLSCTSQNIHRPSGTRSDIQVRHLTIAQQKWPQRGDVGASTLADAPTPRYDWRMRATSRTSGANIMAGEDRETHDLRRRVMKRIPPPQINVGIGEPFYEEINAYSNRHVASLFLLRKVMLT